MLPTVHSLSLDQPYGRSVVEWLWDRKEQLSSLMVIVPTAQSSRRIRQGLAEMGGVLSPMVVTPGHLLQLGGATPEVIEVLAWVEELEAVGDWRKYDVLFPQPPSDETPGWAMSLARSFCDLRRNLQECGLMIRDAAQRIDPLEKERWLQLAKLENGVETRLNDWGYRSQSSELSAGRISFPKKVTAVVVAGVLDLPPILSQILERESCRVDILLPALEELKVDSWGRPLKEWNSVPIEWPEPHRGSVTLVGNPSQQADCAVRKVAEANSPSEDVSLGTGDQEVAPELVRSFARAGWVLHDPGALLPSPLIGWLGAWRRFLINPGVKEVIDLLAFTQGRALVKGFWTGKVRALSGLRDQFLSRHLDDVNRAVTKIEEELVHSQSERKRRRLEGQLNAARDAQGVMREFGIHRTQFLQEGFHRGMQRLLSRIDPEGMIQVEEWFVATSAVAEKVNQPAIFWMDLLITGLSSVSEEVPEGRSLDVQGWLELLHDPARHLIVCGLNEGRIPKGGANDPWLTEAARRQLRLSDEQSRSARDAFLLKALLKMREDNGRVDLIVGKLSQTGDVLLPSRLLLTGKDKCLAEQVVQLFDQVKAPDSGVSWSPEENWKWKPKKVEPRERISVTDFSQYLSCPFRYYLSRVVRMNEPDPERAEWNHRDFGNIMHEVLEQWGRDPIARDYVDSREIKNWTHSALDDLVKKYFGEILPLAVSLQVESMKLRFGWFAEIQAQTRLDGWRVKYVEKDYEIEVGATKIVGQVDRVDEHDTGATRVLDYKTSKSAKNVVGEHLKKFGSELPKHLQNEAVVAPDGKIWRNLQVALYAVALEKVDSVGYFALGEDRANVKIEEWPDFGDSVKDSALHCAEWVIGQIREQVFWPPASQVRYDDFEDLALGRHLEEMVNWEGGRA